MILFLATLLGACKKWDEHIKVGSQDLTQDLLQAISANADLSKFKELVMSAGLDTLLQSSKTFTVWAPSNAALQNLDPAITSDKAKLRSFLMNHIANQTYFVRDAAADTRVAMLNGKYNSFTGSQFDDANLTAADKFVKNGVLHVINKAVPVLPSVWEYITSTTSQYLQNSFITSLNFIVFDSTKATIDSISSTTGQPVYHPGTGLVSRNRFNDRVYDVKREDKLYTYFVIANPGFTLESDSLKPYYKASTTPVTDSLAKWNTVKDLVVEGLYTQANLPAVLESKFGISVPINKTLITETKKLSNGIAYVLSLVDVPTAAKFKQIIVEGERPNGFVVDRISNTQYRVRQNPVTGEIYNDLLVTGHGYTSFYSYYQLNEIPSIKYKVYASAVNDFQTTAFSQSIVVRHVAPPAAATTLATLNYAVPLRSTAGAYNEVLLGEFIVPAYGMLEIQLTASGTNPIVLNYLRLVPVP